MLKTYTKNEAKSDNLWNCKIETAITKSWGSKVKTPILLSQYRKNGQSVSAPKRFLILGAPIIFSPAVIWYFCRKLMQNHGALVPLNWTLVLLIRVLRVNQFWSTRKYLKPVLIIFFQSLLTKSVINSRLKWKLCHLAWHVWRIT